jgi:hypothetical protein
MEITFIDSGFKWLFINIYIYKYYFILFFFLFYKKSNLIILLNIQVLHLWYFYNHRLNRLLIVWRYKCLIQNIRRVDRFFILQIFNHMTKIIINGSDLGKWIIQNFTIFVTKEHPLINAWLTTLLTLNFMIVIFIFIWWILT